MSGEPTKAPLPLVTGAGSLSPMAGAPGGGHARGGPVVEQSDDHIMRFFVAVPATEMRWGAGPSLVGDSLVTHFKDMLPISYKETASGPQGFVPLCLTKQDAVALCQSRIRGAAQRKRAKGKSGVLCWRASDPDAQFAPPPEKKQKGQKISLRRLHHDGESSESEDFMPVPSNNTDFFVKILCMPKWQFAALVLAEKLLKPPRHLLWQEHLQFYQDLTSPITMVRLYPESPEEEVLKMTVVGTRAKVQVQCGPMATLASEKNQTLLQKKADLDRAIREADKDRFGKLRELKELQRDINESFSEELQAIDNCKLRELKELQECIDEKPQAIDKGLQGIKRAATM